MKTLIGQSCRVTTSHKQGVLCLIVGHRCRRVPRALLVASIWMICAGAILSSCARASMPEKQTSLVLAKQSSPPNDLYCDRDADCLVLNRDLNRCCWGCPGKPYPISRSAVERHEARLQATCDGCNPVDYMCVKNRDPADFVAVCVGHACEIREIKAESPSKPIPP
jgi:hypothetical protein